MSARDRRVGKMSIPLQEETSQHAVRFIDFQYLFFPQVKTGMLVFACRDTLFPDIM